MATSTPAAPRSDLQKALRWLSFLRKGWVLLIVIVGVVVLSMASLPLKSQETSGSKIRNLWDDVSYKRTFTLTVADLRDQKLCGILPGTRVVTLPNTRQILKLKDRKIPIHVRYIRKGAGDQNPAGHNLATLIRFNDTIPGEKLLVPEEGPDKGCVTVSFIDPYGKGSKDQLVILDIEPVSEATPLLILATFE